MYAPIKALFENTVFILKVQFVMELILPLLKTKNKTKTQGWVLIDLIHKSNFYFKKLPHGNIS